MAAGTLPEESPLAPETPTILAHAADRWDSRTSVDSISPERAWHEATPLRRRAMDSHDELRVYEPQGVVLCRCDEDIVTVLDAAGPDAEDWLQSLVYETAGPVWLDAPIDERPGGE